MEFSYRGFRERQRYHPLLNEKTGQINEQTADFIRHYAKKWREKSLFQVLLHYRAVRFHEFVNLSQQVHIYSQRIVAGLNKCTRAVPFDRINSREVHSAQLGPMPIPTKKMPFRLDQIPFYDTKYMVDPADSISRQNFSNTRLLNNNDEEPWDSPLQRNPSMTSCLLTYNAYKKEQACQTNWDRMGESDVIYNQNYYRDPQLLRRNQLQSTMQAYNTYNNYNHYNNNSNYYGQQRTGSRRNSLKGYSAPPPPPIPPNNKAHQHNQTQINRINPNNQNRSPYINNTDPVRELRDMARRSYDDNSDEPPYNFRGMLRKTNYPRTEPTTYSYNSRLDMENNEQHTFQNTKLRSTGKRFDERSSSPAYNRPPSMRQNVPSVGKSFENNDVRSFEEAGSYVEEEIAPGVTLTGYAVDI